ncbi:MAG: hypothetical protein M3Z31_11185 [Pseudomonadota bacterium]|nr:hypothetical protein [Pseudomonadota bacterium]
MHLRSPLSRFVLRVLAWLPVTFFVWYFAAPILLWPAAWLARGVAGIGMSDLVRSIEQARSVFIFETTLRPGAGVATGAITVEVNALLYAFGMPLFAALTLAPREARRFRVLAIGYFALLPVVVWGVLADFLKNVAITSGGLVASQAGFSAAQREVIAFAYQFGSLILPTVIPAIVWVVTHRAFLMRIREQPTDAPG